MWEFFWGEKGEAGFINLAQVVVNEGAVPCFEQYQCPRSSKDSIYLDEQMALILVIEWRRERTSTGKVETSWKIFQNFLSKYEIGRIKLNNMSDALTKCFIPFFMI